MWQGGCSNAEHKWCIQLFRVSSLSPYSLLGAIQRLRHNIDASPLTAEMILHKLLNSLEDLVVLAILETLKSLNPTAPFKLFSKSLASRPIHLGISVIRQ